MINYYIEQYGKRLYGLCMTLCASVPDADDLYQETWLKAMKKLDSYNTDKPFEPWITRIAVNTYKDMARRKKRSPVFDSFATTEEKDIIMMNVAVSDEERKNNEIREAVDSLDEKLRMTVILFYFNDLGEKRTAEVLGIPVGTVKSRLNKAKKILKEVLRDEYGL